MRGIAFGDCIKGTVVKIGSGCKYADEVDSFDIIVHDLGSDDKMIDEVNSDGNVTDVFKFENVAGLSMLSLSLRFYDKIKLM